MIYFQSREELNQKSIEELQVQAAESKNLKAVGKVLLQKYCYAGVSNSSYCESFLHS